MSHTIPQTDANHRKQKNIPKHENYISKVEKSDSDEDEHEGGHVISLIIYTKDRKT